MNPDTPIPGAAPLVNQCCVCGRQRVGDAWLALSEGGPFHGGEPARISHTYCPDCLISAPLHDDNHVRRARLDFGLVYDPARRSA